MQLNSPNMKVVWLRGQSHITRYVVALILVLFFCFLCSKRTVWPGLQSICVSASWEMSCSMLSDSLWSTSSRSSLVLSVLVIPIIPPPVYIIRHIISVISLLINSLFIN